MSQQTSVNENKRKRANPTVVSAIAGLLASSVGKGIMHPIDTIKAKLQVISLPGVNSQSIKGEATNGKSLIMNIARETVRSEGIRGLYKGFGIHVGGGIPAGGIYYGSYEFFKKTTLQMPYLQKHPFLAYLMGGIFAETISCIIFVPVDVIKERRQVQANMHSYQYKGDIDAFKQIMKTEGMMGLYRAYGATVASFGPFSAFYFMFYEHFKGMMVTNDPESYLKRTSESGEVKADIGFFQSMFCSMMAGACASTLTNPLDMAKLRMQVMRAGKIGGGTEQYYKHMLDGVYKIGRDEGIRALFNGSLARILFHMPNVAITMSCVEAFKPHIQRAIEGRESESSQSLSKE